VISLKDSRLKGSAEKAAKEAKAREAKAAPQHVDATPSALWFSYNTVGSYLYLDATACFVARAFAPTLCATPLPLAFRGLSPSMLPLPPYCVFHNVRGDPDPNPAP